MTRLTRDAGKVRDLSPPDQQQLNSYALGAAAGGVSLRALAKNSEARIIYTATHRVIADGDSYSLDFTGNGTTDLTLGEQVPHLVRNRRYPLALSIPHRQFGRKQPGRPQCLWLGGHKTRNAD